MTPTHRPMQPWGVFALGLIFAFGLFASFARLGESLDSDELLYASAARSVLRDGSLRLGPGLERLERAPITTWLVAASFRLWGQTEQAARAPGALFACLGLVAVFVVGRRCFGPTVGVWAAGVAAVLPLFIKQARTCGPFAEARFFAFVTAALLLTVIEHARRWDTFRPWLASRRGLAVLVGAAACTTVMLLLHGISAVALAGVLAFAVCVSIADGWRRGARTTLASPLVLLVVAPLTALVIIAAASSRLATFYIPAGVSIRDWSTGMNRSLMTYHWTLSLQGMLLYALLLLGALLALARRRLTETYWAVLFGTAVLLMSVGLRWKAPKLLSVHLGSGVLLCGLAADTLARTLVAAATHLPLGRRPGIAAALVAVAMAAAAVVGGVPQRALAAMAAGTRHTQREAFLHVKEHWQPGDAVVARKLSAARYYLGRVDYKLQGAVRLSTAPDVGEIFGADDFAKALANHPRLWIVIEKDKLHREKYAGSTTVSPAARAVLLRIEPVYTSPPREILVFRMDGPDALKR